jgi:hypothetical protein
VDASPIDQTKVKMLFLVLPIAVVYNLDMDRESQILTNAEKTVMVRLG